MSKQFAVTLNVIERKKSTFGVQIHLNRTGPSSEVTEHKTGLTRRHPVQHRCKRAPSGVRVHAAPRRKIHGLPRQFGGNHRERQLTGPLLASKWAFGMFNVFRRHHGFCCSTADFAVGENLQAGCACCVVLAETTDQIIMMAVKPVALKICLNKHFAQKNFLGHLNFYSTADRSSLF